LQSRFLKIHNLNIALKNEVRFELNLFINITLSYFILYIYIINFKLDDGWLSGFTDAEGCFLNLCKKCKKIL
jgi:hypothetical protein